LSFAGADAFTMLHRGSVLLIGILLVYVLIKALRQPGLRTVAIATLFVLALQVAVGAGSALRDGALFNGLHVAIATLVWSGMLITALLTLPRTDRSPSLARLAVENRPA
jgi:heme A synthase